MTYGLTTQTFTDRNHRATIVVEPDKLLLYFDDAQYPLARVSRNDDGVIECVNDIENSTHATWEDAYNGLIDWATTDIREMADIDAEREG